MDGLAFAGGWVCGEAKGGERVVELGAGGGQLGMEFGETSEHVGAKVAKTCGESVGVGTLLNLIALDGFKRWNDEGEEELVKLVEQENRRIWRVGGVLVGVLVAHRCIVCWMAKLVPITEVTLLG